MDLEQLTDESRSYARELLQLFPQLEASCTAEVQKGFPGQHLLVQVTSPKAPDRNVTIWMESGTEPSLGFGDRGWHTHEDHVRCTAPGKYEAETLIDLLEAIQRDQFVLIEDAGRPREAFGSVLDLRDSQAMLEQLTTPGFKGPLRIKTFTGSGDQDIMSADP